MPIRKAEISQIENSENKNSLLDFAKIISETIKNGFTEAGGNIVSGIRNAMVDGFIGIEKSMDTQNKIVLALNHNLAGIIKYKNNKNCTNKGIVINYKLDICCCILNLS